MGRTLTKPPAAAPTRGRGGDAPWRASPFLLLRFRALFAAITIGALLLALAVAAYPLFTAASAGQLLRNAVERPSITRYAAGLTFTFRDLPLEPVDLDRQFRSPAVGALDEPFRELAAASPILGDPIQAILGDDLEITAAGHRGTQTGRLFSGTGALQQVRVVAGNDGDGVWIPDLIAGNLGVGPGETIRLHDVDGGPTTSVTVDGVFRSFYLNPAGYWFPWSNEFRLTSCPDCAPPPQPIIGDPDQVLALLGDLDQRSATFRWQAPMIDPSAVSIEQARALEAYAREVGTRIGDREDLGARFLCCRRWFYGGFVNGTPVNSGSALTEFASSIGYAVDDAEKQIVAVEGPARVLGIAGVAVALVVVAAAGAFAIRARRVEAAWLFARGTSSVAVGLKTALESALPCVVGGILGFGLAAVAVAALGPNGRVDPGEFRAAALGTALAVAGALVLISVVAAWTYVRVVDPHGRRFARLLSLVPWELAIIALAFVALRQLRSVGAFVEDPQHVVRPSLALVAFPFLLLTGFATLAARLALMGFVWLRGPTGSARPAPYLAIRRLGGGGAFVMLLLGAAGLCLGTFLHAQIVSASLETTVEAKAKIFVGSDVGARVQWTHPAPENFPYPVTRAVEADGAARTPVQSYDLLAVDPHTLAGAAYWNDAFSALSLEEIAARLAGDGDDGPMPIVVAAGPRVAPQEIQIGTAHVPVRIVGRATSFPGLRSTRPMIVADEAAVERALDRAGAPIDPLRQSGSSTELWIKGDPQGVQAALADAAVPTYLVVTAEQVQDIPQVSAVLDTFVVLNVLGVVAAALTFVGILMYLQARERSGVVSYALSTRMGMTHEQHRRALVLELGAMLMFAVVVGAVLAIAAAWFTVPLLDPIATIPPEPLLVIPAGLVALTAMLAAGFAWLGAAATNRRARRVDLGEVMRVAE
jgi:putative ABC transport system permease protein